MVLQPRASSEGVQGAVNGALKVRVTEPATEGRANLALIRLLARIFEVPRSKVEIVGGHTSRRKLVKVWGVDAREAMGYLRKCWGIVQR